MNVQQVLVQSNDALTALTQALRLELLSDEAKLRALRDIHRSEANRLEHYLEKLQEK